MTSTSYDHRFALDDLNIDYEDIDDFTIFSMIIASLSVEDTSILFGDNLELQHFKPEIRNEDIILVDESTGHVIDITIYGIIVEFLRETHGLKRNYKKAGNKMARHYRMVEERKIWEEELQKADKNQSMLAPLMSALINCADFKYNYETVWDLTIYQFMDAVKRITNTVNYRNLMMGIYTGNMDSKSIPQQDFNWLRELKK